jgi:hypothetical protein
MLGLIAAAPVCNDKDWDGIQDKDDNCADIYNPLQADENANGIGDPCDINTPMHEFHFASCYRTNWSGLTGPGFEDIAFSLYSPNQLLGTGRLDWPDMIHDTLEDGPLEQNGRDIWFMGQWIGAEIATATYFEGTMAAADDHNVITKIQGSYQMLECDNCEYNLTWSAKWQGTFTGDVMPPEYCKLPGDDDTALDDDTTDDDATDDDAVDDDATSDDDASADDDSAGDDDATADDDHAASGDDDNSGSGCGC